MGRSLVAVCRFGTQRRRGRWCFEAGRERPSGLSAERQAQAQAHTFLVDGRSKPGQDRSGLVVCCCGTWERALGRP